MKFNNPDVEAKYCNDHPGDPVVHLPGGKSGNGWKGKLSDVPLEHADRWFSRPGQNLFKLKEAGKIAKPKDNKDGKNDT